MIENAQGRARRATEIAGLEKPTSCETRATPTDSATSNNDSKQPVATYLALLPFQDSSTQSRAPESRQLVALERSMSKNNVYQRAAMRKIAGKGRLQMATIHRALLTSSSLLPLAIADGS
jgi:hypothetical protein